MKLGDLTNEQIAAAMASKRTEWATSLSEGGIEIWSEFYYGRVGYLAMKREQLLDELGDVFFTDVTGFSNEDLNDETIITGNKELEEFFSKTNIETP